MIGDVPVTATLTGVLRGLIRDGYPVTEGFKIVSIIFKAPSAAMA